MNPEESLIAPCGMNCALCLGYQRTKNHCIGCNLRENSSEKPTRHCTIWYCPERLASGIDFCGDCVKFPCRRMKEIDKRYRTKYHMSMIENLLFIRENGLELFMQKEKVRWKCPNCGEMLCVHRDRCQHCNAQNVFD